MAFTAGKHHRVAAPVVEHLERKVRRRAEPHQRDAVAGCDLGTSERPVSDDARGEQRRGFEVAERIGQGDRERLRHRERVGVAAVDGPTGEVGALAEVLLAP